MVVVVVVAVLLGFSFFFFLLAVAALSAELYGRTAASQYRVINTMTLGKMNSEVVKEGNNIIGTVSLLTWNPLPVQAAPRPCRSACASIGAMMFSEAFRPAKIEVS